MRIRALAFLFACLIAPAAGAEAWIATERWSPEWENRYSSWVRESWHPEIFSTPTLADGRKNPYYGLRPDCADAVYSMRAIFAYEHRLPFGILDPTGSGRVIGHTMKRFDRLPSERRFVAFLRSLYDMVSTRSLSDDLYPVPVTPAHVRSGSVMKTVAKNHHSWTVKAILPIGVPWLVFASTVNESTPLSLYQRQSWPNPAWVFEGNSGASSEAGFHNFRPLEYLGRPAWTIPGYSEEQYKIPVSQWIKWAQSRLAVRNETDEQQLRRLAQTACQGLAERVGSVTEGLAYLRANPNQCMGYSTYDTYSTPNRDERFFDDLVALRSAYRSARSSYLPPSLRRQLDRIFPAIEQSARAENESSRPRGIDADSMCPVSYGPGKMIDLAEAKRRLFAGWMSHNPHDDLEYRWGEKRGPSPLAARCPSWDKWTPNLELAGR